MEQVKRVFLATFLLVAILYAGICGLLFATQRSLIYFPQPRSNRTSSTLMTLPTNAGTALVSTRTHSGPGALIYFGGNAEDVSQAMPYFAETFPDRAIYLLHYRVTEEVPVVRPNRRSSPKQ